MWFDYSLCTQCVTCVDVLSNMRIQHVLIDVLFGISYNINLRVTKVNMSYTQYWSKIKHIDGHMVMHILKTNVLCMQDIEHT